MTQLTFDFSRALAKTWQPGDEVVVTRLDHDANIRPWLIAAESAADLWLLGSSDFSAQLAAARGLPYVFAHHFSGRGTAEALELYRSGYQPSERYPEPRTFLTVNAVVAVEACDAAFFAPLGGQAAAFTQALATLKRAAYARPAALGQRGRDLPGDVARPAVHV